MTNEDQNGKSKKFDFRSGRSGSHAFRITGSPVWRTLALLNSLYVHDGSVSVAARTPISDERKNVIETSLNLVAELSGSAVRFTVILQSYDILRFRVSPFFPTFHRLHQNHRRRFDCLGSLTSRRRAVKAPKLRHLPQRKDGPFLSRPLLPAK